MFKRILGKNSRNGAPKWETSPEFDDPLLGEGEFDRDKAMSDLGIVMLAGTLKKDIEELSEAIRPLVVQDLELDGIVVSHEVLDWAREVIANKSSGLKNSTRIQDDLWNDREKNPRPTDEEMINHGLNGIYNSVLSQYQAKLAEQAKNDSQAERIVVSPPPEHTVQQQKIA